MESARLFSIFAGVKKREAAVRFAMRFPSECYQIHQTPRQTMPHLSEARTKGLALRICGLRSPNLWEKIRSFGWRPYMRQSINRTFEGQDAARRPAAAPNLCIRRLTD